MKVNGKNIPSRLLGEGGYNKTYVSLKPFPFEVDGKTYTQRWIKKIPKLNKDDDLFSAMNHAKRAVRLWNELNPKYPAVALPKERGWLAPYIPGKQASDQQVFDKQIEIYRQRRRIVADACGDNNFLLFNGEIFCVDIDQAVIAIGSPVSKRIADDLIEFGHENSVMEDYWDDYEKNDGMVKSVQLTKTLFYLEQQLKPEQILDKYITAPILEKLADYQKNKQIITQQVLDELLELTKATTAKASSTVGNYGSFWFQNMVSKVANVIYQESPKALKQ